MKKTKRNLIIVFLVLISICVIFIFLSKNYYKVIKFGNNTTIKTLNDVEGYILNISSYSAQIEVTTNSNKNTNKYLINQKYTAPNLSKQEVVEPSNIKGLTTTYDGTNLQIANSKININALYENYTYIADNALWLNTFISDYSKTQNKSIKEQDGEYVIEVKVDKNKYITYKTLYIDKNTSKPTKMLILDENKKSTICIIYKEIKINETKDEEVLAFRLNKFYENEL